jgi:excisionase family DNA binding protein
MRAETEFLSIDQVAERLGLHVRTVRRYVREGRLGAVRIGKQYRVAHEALDALTGPTAATSGAAATTTATTPMTAPPTRHVEVSSIVHADAIDKATADRVTIALLAAAKGRADESDPLRIDTVYDPERARLKIFLSGSAPTTASLLKFVNLYLET